MGLLLALALGLVAAAPHPAAGSACDVHREIFPAVPIGSAGEAACAGMLAEACDAGRRLACAELGLLLEQGGALRRDGPRALQLLGRACDAGVAWACAELGFALLRRGEVVRGRELLRDACAAGDGPACTAGLADTSDPGAAHRLAERACDLGDPEGCLALAARTPGGPAEETLDRACRLGSAEACIALRADAVEEHCREGDAVECVQLAVLVEEGRVLVADGARAARLYERACTAGRDDACVRLARLHRYGAGVPRDEAKARALLAGACAHGEQEACRVLDPPAEAPR